ncbi:MAG: glycosyltransferase [Thermoplasmatota archaeon]
MTLQVLQSVHNWLPPTQNWLHAHLSRLPADVASHVVADWSKDPDAFPMPRLDAVSRATGPRRILEARFPALRRRRGSRLRQRVAAAHGPFPVVHSHFGDRGCYDLPFVGRLGAAHVVNFYGYDVIRQPHASPAWGRRYQRLFRDADRLLAEGPVMIDSLRKLGAPEEKLVIHPLGVDLAALPFRPRHYDGNGPLRVLMAASWREKKGLPYAVEALGRLAKEHDVEVEATLIGAAAGSEDGQAEKRRILGALAASGLEDQVRLPGFQDHGTMMAAAYDHHLFLSPSVTAADGDVEGGVPVAIIEMAATGMPVVSTTHCDIPFVLQGDASRLLAPERDVDALVDRLAWLVSHPGEWTPMVASTRSHLESGFEVGKRAEALGRLYQEVVGA